MKPDGGSISDIRRFYLLGCGPLWRVDFRRGMGSHWTGRRVAALLCRRVSWGDPALGAGTSRDWLGRSTVQTFIRVGCVRNWEGGAT